MIKVAIIGVMAALLVIPLKREKGEIGLLVILAACLLILSLSQIYHLACQISGSESLYVTHSQMLSQDNIFHYISNIPVPKNIYLPRTLLAP